MYVQPTEFCDIIYLRYYHFIVPNIVFVSSVIILVLPGGSLVKNEGDAGLIPGSRRYPGEGNGHPLQYSCLKNSMDRGALWATLHRVAKESETTQQPNNNSKVNFSHDRLFVTLWTAAHQAPLLMEFTVQEHWTGLLFLFPRDLPNLGIEPMSLRFAPWQAGSLPLAPSGKLHFRY